MSRVVLAGLMAAALALAAGREAGAAHARGQELLPIQDHTTPEARALAEVHRADLGILVHALARCEPDLDVHLHGIGFRRPRGVDAAKPHLAAWVWLDRAVVPAGADLAARAGDVFARTGRRLFRRLLSSQAVEVDPRLGGYAVVLTWFPPGRGDPPVGETVVVFADKASTIRFVRDGEVTARFLGTADVRYFDGTTPVQAPRPTALDLTLAPPADGC